MENEGNRKRILRIAKDAHKLAQNEEKLFSEILIPENRTEKTFYIDGLKITMVEFRMKKNNIEVGFIMKDGEIVTDEKELIWFEDIYQSYLYGYSYYASPKSNMKNLLEKMVELTDKLMFFGKFHSAVDSAKDFTKTALELYIQINLAMKKEAVFTSLEFFFEQLKKWLKYMYINDILAFFKESTQEALRILRKDEEDLTSEEIYFLKNYFEEFDNAVEMVVKAVKEGYDLEEYGWGDWVIDLLSDYVDVTNSLIGVVKKNVLVQLEKLKIKVGRIPKFLKKIGEYLKMETAKEAVESMEGLKKMIEGLEERDSSKVTEGAVEFAVNGVIAVVYGTEFTEAHYGKISKRMLKKMYEVFKAIDKAESFKEAAKILIKAFGNVDFVLKITKLDYSWMYDKPTPYLRTKESFFIGLELLRELGIEKLSDVIKGEKPNRSPSKPSDPDPADNARDLSTRKVLSWHCSDPDGDELTYDIYFGTNPNPPLVKSDHTSNTYDPGQLQYSTTYYWKVVAKDGRGGITQGPIWRFTTENEPNIQSYLFIMEFSSEYFTGINTNALEENGYDYEIIENTVKWISTVTYGEGDIRHICDTIIESATAAVIYDTGTKKFRIGIASMDSLKMLLTLYGDMDPANVSRLFTNYIFAVIGKAINDGVIQIQDKDLWNTYSGWWRGTYLPSFREIKIMNNTGYDLTIISSYLYGNELWFLPGNTEAERKWLLPLAHRWSPFDEVDYTGRVRENGDASIEFDLSINNAVEIFTTAMAVNDNGENSKVSINDETFVEKQNCCSYLKQSYLNNGNYTLELFGHKTWSHISPRIGILVIGGNIVNTSAAISPDEYGDPHPMIIRIPQGETIIENQEENI
ncbi:MAG: fibronectin type III domain-containing protein [Thermotogae bacterium]|nr:fibronectin type III domain-containing protein [Thermotogota bacterium]